MDFDKAVTSLAKQFAVIWQAPIPFIVAVGILVFVAWRVLEWRYAATIDRLKEYVTHLERAPHRSAVPVAAHLPDRSPVSLPEPPIPAPPAERVFVPEGVTLQSLAGVTGKMSGIQAHKVTASYKGKWIKVTGHVFSSGMLAGEAYLGIVPDLTADLGERLRTQVTAHFRSDAGLETISYGDTVTIEGEIEEVDRFGLILVNCQLV